MNATTASKNSITKIALIVAGALIGLCILVVGLGVVFRPTDTTIQTAIANTQAEWTSVPTLTAYPTYTDVPTIVITKLVTPTFTPTPEFTTTKTFTPAPPTATPNIAQTATAEQLAYLRSDKDDGFYLVGVDIAAGLWRSTGTGSGCYWSLTSKTGDIIDNHFGMAGGTAYIPASAFQVEFSDCGTWVFLSP